MKSLSFAVSFAAMFALVSCASNVPPPEEMPDGNPAYAEAFGDPRPVESEETVVGVVA